ncbi:MAG: DUF86 domain-containing protein [Candidatus Nealsonbacteria bacterium DGGOD1a]|nr:MAG: DUF86 domain-containing protein [Candidatus Nealsonbacteria bacterium DGGOD1a]
MKCIESVEQFTKGVSKKDFWNNDEKQSAIFRKLEIIGEAANHTSTLFRKKYPEIPWRDVCGLRNRLIHEYFGINAERVWNIIKDDLPVLKKQIEIILKDLKKIEAKQKKLL